MKKSIFIKSTTIVFALFILLISCDSSSKKTEQKVEENESEQIDSSTVDESPKVDVSDLVEAKDVSELNDAQLKVQELLRYSANKNYESFAQTLAYIGEDENRIYQDNFNYSDPKERQVVRITLDVIKRWLGESADYDFISYESAPTEIGTIHSVEILFKKEGVGVERKFFRLRESTNKGMLLVSID